MSRRVLRLSRKLRISIRTGPVRYASRSSRTRSPVNTNDTRRRSFRSTRSRVQPAQCRKLARNRSLVMIAEESAVTYFLIIYAPLSGVVVGPLRSVAARLGTERPFLFSQKSWQVFFSISKKIHYMNFLCKCFVFSFYDGSKKETRSTQRIKT
jgi:hypothetical protein